jgi:WD40 repeat protein
MQPTGMIEGHKGSITALRFARNGGIDWLLSGSEDGKARLWDLERKKAVRCFLPSAGADDAEITSVCHGQDSDADLIGISYNTSVAVFDVREPALVTRKAAMSFALHQDEVNDIAMSSFDGRVHLAAGDDNGEVLIHDLRAKKLIRRISNAHDNICASVAFRRGHPWQVISAGLDGKLVHWNYWKSDKVRTLATFGTTQATASSKQMVNPRFPYAVACDSAGQMAAAALGDGSVTFYDLQAKKLVQEWEACENMVNAIEWAPEPLASAQRPMVLCGGTDGYVSVADMTTEAAPSLSLRELQDALSARTPAAATAAEAGGGTGSTTSGKTRCLLKLICSSQINSIACTPEGRVYVGDQGHAILEFDLKRIASSEVGRGDGGGDVQSGGGGVAREGEMDCD